MSIGLLAAVLLSFARPAAAQPGNLNFFKNYFITGDYKVHGLGLKSTGVNGFATGTINFSGVPDGADVLAAFLYWETIVRQGQTGTAGATFRGQDISAAKELNPTGSAPCWSAGGGTGGANGTKKMKAYRADVRRFLPIGTDGKRQANGPHQVKLPESGSGNGTPMTLGASLVVIYRDPSPTAPLRSVVIYDGGYTMDQSTDSFSQTLQGFYQPSSTPAARMTMIVGSGQAGFSERLLFNNQSLTAAANTTGSINPFVGARGPDWDNPEFTNLPLGSGASSAVVTVDHFNFTPFDCLSWGATIFSTAVQDTDNDGLLDIWETSTTLVDPLGVALPNLAAMGADPNIKDVFIEIGYMTTPGYSGGQGTVTAHSHVPSDTALAMVARAFRDAPVDPLPGNKFKGVRLHFDVGANYQPGVLPSATSCQDKVTWTVQCAIVPASLARGGETIDETSCATHPECQFPDYPGTVGWKNGYRILRDQPLNYPTEEACVLAGSSCTRRFDSNRKAMFRYALFAHALGLARPDDPHVPRQTSGIADFIGGDLMVTLGFFDGFVGSSEMQASTLMHELGHTFGRRHGGPQGQPNCKPNYQSVMNYLFQIGLLINATGDAEVGYSRQVLPGLNEGANLGEGLSEAAGLGSMLYRTRWYAPLSGSFIDNALTTTPATKYCTGATIPPELDFVRVDGTSTTAPIDWNADGLPTSGLLVQDINLDDDITALDAGTNDWDFIDLRQVGARRNAGLVSLDLGFTDLGFTDLGFTDLGFTDLGFTDLGFTDLGFTDLGFTDLGFTDLGAPQDGDIDFTTAKESGGNVPHQAPLALTKVKNKPAVVVSWRGPSVAAQGATYRVLRVEGSSVTTANFPNRVVVTTPTTTALTVTDVNVKNNTTYTYFVQALLADGTNTGISNQRTITVK